MQSKNPLHVPRSHLLTATKSNDFLCKASSLLPCTLWAISCRCPTATSYLCCTCTHEEMWGPRNLPQLGKKPAPTREREARRVTTWQSSQSPRQMPAHFCKIIHLVLCKLYSLKKEINPGHHCLNLKHPGWQSFHVYSLASDISLLPFRISCKPAIHPVHSTCSHRCLLSW